MYDHGLTKCKQVGIVSGHAMFRPGMGSKRISSCFSVRVRLTLISPETPCRAGSHSVHPAPDYRSSLVPSVTLSTTIPATSAGVSIAALLASTTESVAVSSVCKIPSVTACPAAKTVSERRSQNLWPLRLTDLQRCVPKPQPPKLQHWNLMRRSPRCRPRLQTIVLISRGKLV